jgi:voltage-gated potassium channel
MSLRSRIYRILQPYGRGAANRTCELSILALIALNVLAIILDSVPEIAGAFGHLFDWIEVASVAVFSVEYVLRLWTCVEDPRHARPVVGRLRFALRPLAVIDLLAVLPAYLPFTGLDLLFLRSVRLVRLFRVGKLGRYSRALHALGRVVRNRRTELAVTFSVMLMLLIVSAIALYYTEHEAQPKAFPHIPAAMWWAVNTLTTVGYGDICPITPLGKVLASVLAFFGVAMFALPTGIMAAGFLEEVQKAKPGSVRCPHCGKSFLSGAAPADADADAEEEEGASVAR